MKNLLGAIGLIDKEQEPIEYRERPPLVLPPKMDLRQPVEPGVARQRTAWPDDPDVVRKRRKARDEAKPETLVSGRRQPDDPRLAPIDPTTGRVAAQRGGPPPRYMRPDNHRDDILTPDQLRAQTPRGDDTSALIVGQEPRRTALTQPPKGFRTPTAVVAPKSEPIKRRDEADPTRFIKEEAKTD